MSKYILLVIFLTIGHILARESPFNPSGMVSVTPQSAINPDQTVMNINNLTVWVRKDGFHHWIVDGSWNGTFPKGTAGFIFSEGTMWGGLVNDGKDPRLRVGGSTYRSGNVAGAILIDESGIVIGREDPDDPSVRPYRVRPDWDTSDLKDDAANFFLIPSEEVTEDQMTEIRLQYEADWNEWPAKKGAPYEDIDNDRMYNPEIDIPGVPGSDQTLWIVYNDLDTLVEEFSGSPPIGLEVQETYWAYSRYGAVRDAVFKRVRVIFKGTEITPMDASIEDFYLSQWSDPDNGQYTNDYIGCDTTLDLGYVYNGTVEDIVWDHLGIIPPAGGYTLLSGPITYTGVSSDSAWVDFRWRHGYRNLPMTTFTYVHPSREPLQGASIWYNSMRGCEQRPSFPACEPVRDHLGNEIMFEFAGDPVQGTGHIEGQTGPQYPPGDRKFFLSSGPLSLARWGTQEIVIALVGSVGSDRLLSIASLKDRVKWVRRSFRSDFTDLGPGTELIELAVPHNSEDTGPFEMVFDIQSDSLWQPALKSLWLHYSAGGIKDSVALEGSVNPDTPPYTAIVPAFPQVTGTTELHYHVSVKYEDGTKVLLPSGAPINHGVLVFGPDTTAPEVSGLNYLPDVLYLLDDSAKIRVEAKDDRFPVSAWAKWRINATGDIHESPMDTTWVNMYWYYRKMIWSGQIKWENLALSDTVYYWVEAVDSSKSNNVGKSEEMWFVARNYQKIGNWEDRLLEDWVIDGWHNSAASEYGNVMETFGIYREGPYVVNLELLRPFSFPDESTDLYIKFFHKYRFGGIDGLFQIRADTSEWETLSTFTGEVDFHPVLISLDPYRGADSIFVRFRSEIPSEGGFLFWYLDDVYLTADSTVMAIEDKITAVPIEYKLHHPYPNPFNPATTIQYDLPRSGHVSLTIYDLLGREVAVAVSRWQEAGRHSVVWDATDIPTGIYFVRMSSGNFSQVRKVMVLR